MACAPAMCQVYDIRVPGAGASTRIETSVSYGGGWEVTVDFDAVRCELHCTYRRLRFAGGLLPRPATTIQVRTDFASKPITIVVDPAGLGLPSAVSVGSARSDDICASGRHFFAPSQSCESVDASRSPRARLPLYHPANLHAATAPLRI
jgi:hypothetical protein